MKAIADVEKAIVEALDKQYADVLSPLKENLSPKKFGFKYVQKLAKRSVNPYTVPDEVSTTLKLAGSFWMHISFALNFVYIFLLVGNSTKFHEENA